MSVPHYFIAVPLPAALKEHYSRWQETLKKEFPYKQWTYKEDLHITLKFLGPVEGSRFACLQTGLTQLETCSPFFIETGRKGFFGNPRHPRVLWAGAELTDPLALLKQKTEEIAGYCGFPGEKRAYRPHITLAKKWLGTSDENIANKLNQLELTETAQLYVEEVVLYQIDPQDRPKYRIAGSYRLIGGDENRPAD